MRKWLIGLVAGVIVVLLALPFAFGLHAEKLLNQLDGMHIPLKKGEFGTLEFTVTDLHRGWLSSTVTLQLNYLESPLLASSAQNTSETTLATKTKPSKTLLIAKANILHGPILWRTDVKQSHPFWGQAWLAAPVEYVTDNLPERFVEVTGLKTGDLMGYVSLLGEQTYYASTNEIGFQDDAGQLNFSGFDLELVRSRSGENLVFDLTIPHFNFVLYPDQNKQGGLRWLMDGIEVKFAGTADHPAAFWYGTWYGDMLGSVGTIQLEAEDNNYSLTRLSTNSSQKQGKNAEVLEGKAQLEMENLTINQQVFGPVEASVSYANIDRAALEGMRRLYNNWLADSSSQPFFESLTAEQQQEFLQDVFKLVNQLPIYALDNLTISTSSGRVNGDFSIKVTAPAKEISDLQTLTYWQRSLDAAIDIDASQVIAQEVTAWALQRFYAYMNPLFKLPIPNNQSSSESGAANPIDYHAEAQSLLKQAQVFGVIKSIDNDYVLGAHYKEGLLSINGKTIIDLSNRNNK